LSLAESALLIGLSVFQVYYIRQWFNESEKKTKGRV
jgi:hypothetical protein